jgi:TPR repeat protein
MKYILILLLAVNVVLADDLKDGLEALKNENYKLAAQFFEKSANSGNDIAKYNLAVMYNNGLGVKKDNDKSSLWIEKASKSDENSGKYTIKELEEFASYSDKYSKNVPAKFAKKRHNNFVLIN